MLSAGCSSRAFASIDKHKTMVSPTPPNGLIVKDLTKSYISSGKTVFNDLNFEVKTKDRLAILGRNGQGKSTLIKILGGVLGASSGSVTWKMSSSWPIGFGGGFQGSLSGLDNIRFLARLYDRDYSETLERVDDFARLGPALIRPVKEYSSGMRARLAFGLSLAIEFDCYLIDELVSVGDAHFQNRCNDELFSQRADRAFIMASHDMNMITSLCDRALIIESGRAKMFHDVEEAVEIYRWLQA